MYTDKKEVFEKALADFLNKDIGDIINGHLDEADQKDTVDNRISGENYK